MVPDEPTDEDMVFTEGGVTYLVSKELYESVKPIRVDFVESPMESGFQISSNLENACGSCSC
jgi:Fe-S cluster assembly iron-binding protein IscA